MRNIKYIIPIVIGIEDGASLACAGSDLTTTNSVIRPDAAFAAPPMGIWQGEIGEGFRSTAQTVSLEAGATTGFQIFGGEQNHDLALASISYGHMLSNVLGENHWYRGNWEIRGELFVGEQFSPSNDWLVGLTPHLRYNLATGTRWIPFVDGGLGVGATEIGSPDLSGTFEFNIQGNIGVHWFVRDDLALTFEAGYLHVSDAGIHDPNQGLNCATGKLGVTWFF
jgi:lipid A 3-O-deacylase